MPSLHPGLPGTKEVYGLSLIREGGRVILPPNAVAHYGLVEGDSVLLITTHRGEGGFAISRQQTAARSVFASAMARVSGLDAVIWWKDKAYALTTFTGGGIHLNPELLAAYHVQVEQRLMVVKSTTVALSCTPVEIWVRKFFQRGLFLEVNNIRELELY